MAYVAAAGGSVAWNAVSKQATWGTSGSACRTMSSAASDRGWWIGASEVRARSRDKTVSSTTVACWYTSPPWTTRCPTASTAPRPAISSATIRGASAPATVSSVFAPVARPSASTTDSLSVDEPAFTTRTRAAVTTRLRRPSPVADLGHVQPLDPGVRPRLEALVDHQLPHVAGLRRQPGHPIDDVHHEMEPVEVVHDHHVERRRRRPFLLVAPDVQVLVVPAPVREPVDQPWVAVVREDHRARSREQRVELRVG